MSSKQDGVAVRTAAELERKLNYGQKFAEVYGIATDARTAAEEALQATEQLDSSLTQEEVFNRLTNNGTSQAIYRENGEIYINASFIKTGSISSDMIKAGIIRSVDYEVKEVDPIYPGTDVFPDSTMYPSHGEDIVRGIEIDFAAGVIRGVLVSNVTDELAARISALEAIVFPKTTMLEGEDEE